MDSEIHITSVQLLLTGLIYLIPVFGFIGGIIWKVSKLAHQIQENKKDVDGIANKVRSMLEEIERINSNMIDKINSLSHTVTELLTTVRYVDTNITEIKVDLKALHKPGQP